MDGISVIEGSDLEIAVNAMGQITLTGIACHTFPHRNNNGTAVTQMTQARSVKSLLDTHVDDSHKIEGLGGFQGKSEIVGFVKNVDFNKPLNDEIRSIPTIVGIVLFPIPSVRKRLSQRVEDYGISTELRYSVKQSGLYVGIYPNGQYYAWTDAPEDLRNCINIEEGRVINNYNGQTVTHLHGGWDGIVNYTGLGITMFPADRKTKGRLQFVSAMNSESPIFLENDEDSYREINNMSETEYLQFMEGWEKIGIAYNRWITVAEENTMPDSHFIWVRYSKTGDKSQDRKLPYKYPDGQLSRSGLRGAWAALHGARGGVNLAGGPNKEECLKKCRNAIIRWNKEHPEEAITIKEKGGAENMAREYTDDEIARIKQEAVNAAIKEASMISKEDHEKALAKAAEDAKNALQQAIEDAKKNFEKEKAEAIAMAIREKEAAYAAERLAREKLDERLAEGTKQGYVFNEAHKKRIGSFSPDEAGEIAFQSYLRDELGTPAGKRDKITISNMNRSSSNRMYYPPGGGDSRSSEKKLGATTPRF